MNKIIFTLLLFTTFNSYSQVVTSKEDTINMELKNELEHIFILDQGIREIADGNVSKERKAEQIKKMDLEENDTEGNKMFSVMQEIDSLISFNPNFMA